MNDPYRDIVETTLVVRRIPFTEFDLVNMVARIRAHTAGKESNKELVINVIANEVDTFDGERLKWSGE